MNRISCRNSLPTPGGLVINNRSLRNELAKLQLQSNGMDRRLSMPRRLKLTGLIALWVAAIAFGLHALMSYKGKPGAVGETPSTWPANHLIDSPSQKPLLIMFAHPRCPCTKASLGELELLVAKAKDKFDAAVLFYEPEESPENWSKTTSVELARAIPGVRVIVDKDGQVAQRFAAETSGHTMVYTSAGQLLFSGGITGSRGHQGENHGFDVVLRILQGEQPPLAWNATQVFGCGLFEPCTSR